MFGFILADLRRSWAGALAIGLILAFATALGVAVTLQERALRLGSARAAEAFDLVVGAPGSETQLVLSAVFLQPAPLTLLPGEVLARLAADPRAAWTAPIGFGDAYDGLPVAGTTQALVDGLGGIAEGATFARLGDAVAGADVPLALGAQFHPVHAELASAGEVHAEASYTIRGRLRRTGSPWDRAILVPIESVWRIHGLGDAAHHEDHAEDPGTADHDEADHDGADHDGAAHDEGDHDQAAHDEGDHDGADHDEADHDGGHAGHAHGGFDPAAPIDPEAARDPDGPGAPAVAVRAKRIADAYNLRQDYRSDRTIAVFPAEVLTRLYGALGDARSILAAVAAAAQALVATALLLVVTVQVLQRRRQIGALRAFGAARGAVFAIVWGETALIAGLGVLLGFGLGYGAARAISARLEAASGLRLPVEFVPADGLLFLALLLAAALCALPPAAIAYRQPPAAALRG